ncbi:protein of unknown function (plasmid) [Cupriavidus taiwanensis]|nr:protein of unknown function [Cupriavidus taiwanensis]
MSGIGRSRWNYPPGLAPGVVG